MALVMLRAFRLGSIYFLVIPLLTFLAYRVFGVARPSTQVAYTVEPNYITLLLCLLVLITVSLVWMLSNRPAIRRHQDEQSYNVPKFLRWMFFYFLIVEIVNIFVIDRNAHWLESSHNYFVPDVIQFLMHPFQWFSWAIAIIIVCGGKAELGLNARLAWLISAVFLTLAVANSGNRILIALTFLFYYAHSSPARRKQILLCSPIIALLGFYLSTYILAARVNVSHEVILAYYGGRDAVSSLISAVNLITEALNAVVFQNIFEDYWLNPEIQYGIVRTFVTFIPGYSPVDTFNIEVGKVYAPGVGMSLNSTIYGYFVYSFGILGFPLLAMCMIGFYQIEWYANDPLVEKIMFVIVLASVRFGLEYLIYCSLYIVFTILMLRVFSRQEPDRAIEAIHGG